MFTRKHRILLAALTVVVAIAVVPASSFALTAKPTGDPQLDDYCQQAAALIDKAITQGNLALVNGDDDGASEWFHLAAEMIEHSQGAGCSFSARKIRHILNRVDVGLRQAVAQLPTAGTSAAGSSGSLHLPPGSSPIGDRQQLEPVLQ
jgi:hypothetical protein